MKAFLCIVLVLTCSSLVLGDIKWDASKAVETISTSYSDCTSSKTQVGKKTSSIYFYGGMNRKATLKGDNDVTVSTVDCNNATHVVQSSKIYPDLSSTTPTTTMTITYTKDEFNKMRKGLCAKMSISMPNYNGPAYVEVTNVEKICTAVTSDGAIISQTTTTIFVAFFAVLATLL